MIKRKVYDIILKKHEPFHFYDRNGKLTNICNRKYPKPCTGYQLWNTDNTFKKIINPNGNIESVIFPTWLAEKENVEKAFISQIPPFLDYLQERDYTKNYNIFLLRKDWDNWYTQISIGAWKSKGTRRNREVEHLIERIERLRVFS